MTPITAFLAERLSEIGDEALVAVAVIANVDPGVARRAKSGELVKASDALRLLAARGYDPVTRKAIAPRRLGRFDHDVLKLFLVTQMKLRHDSIRVAAQAMGASPSAVQSMRCGIRVSLSNILKACGYLKVHPFEQCELVREAA